MTDLLLDQLRLFARHLRDPANNAAPAGVAPERLKVYRDLFFNSLEGLLSGSFPVTSRTLGKPAWLRLVRSFYADYRCTTPRFPEVAGELVSYLQQCIDPPWLAELAHFEWTKQALQFSDATPPADDPSGDVLDSILQLSPLAEPLGYQWPVSEIGPHQIPKRPPAAPVLLLAHRDATHRLSVTPLSPLAYRLLLAINSQPRTGHQHFAELATEAGVDPKIFQDQAMALLERLRSDGVVSVSSQQRGLPANGCET